MKRKVSKIVYIIFPIILILLIIPTLAALVMNYREARDFDIQVKSIDKEINTWPPQNKWDQFTDQSLNIMFKYPPGWSVHQITDSVTIEWDQWSGANHVVVNRTMRNETNLDKQIESILLERYHLSIDKIKLIKLRDDFKQTYTNPWG